jgi:imidazolonepropionase
MSLLIRGAKALVNAHREVRHLVRGNEMAHLPLVEDAFLLIENDRIVDFGPMTQCPQRADTVIDATGRYVFPAWCDSHTHIVYAGSREEEFEYRIRGMSYEEIAARGGGILNSARRLQTATEDELFDSAWQRLQEVIQQGTGAIEVKSGYGLTTESELKMLRVIRRLREHALIPIKSTFLGAHAIPAEYRDRRADYIQLLTDEMLPLVASEGLADYCDVFCDRGFFTPAETDTILRAAARWGLKAKIHANELGLTGGVQAGVAAHAISVDHLEHCSEVEIECLKNSTTLPTLLPGCAFFLGIPFPPARAMIDAGLPVVLASDYNPGSSPSGRMPFVVSLACIKMNMLPAEAIQAATLNGAAALELSAQCGSIAPGKLANVFISTVMPSLAFLPYSYGSNCVETVITAGKVWQPHFD